MKYRSVTSLNIHYFFLQNWVDFNTQFCSIQINESTKEKETQMKEKLNKSLSYAPKEAVKIIKQYLPHPYGCLNCLCGSKELEDITKTGKDSLSKLKIEFEKLVVPVHLRQSFFNKHGGGDKSKAIIFNITQTLTILASLEDKSNYPELPEKCRAALIQLKEDISLNSTSASTPLLSSAGLNPLDGRDEESYTRK